ncbi:DUF5812 family protein [Halobellus rufus]|uniref:DUF5812 family protein n=1 Tax=Halobellus rufus TaxID=1448860 RepID=UPI000679A637|nr:DUF5812 family protein [Halobellus rufus]
MTDADRDLDEPNRGVATESDEEGEIEGTFLVTAAEPDSAVLKNVESGQVHTLSSNPGVERADVVEGVVAPDPPLNVSYQLVETASRRSLSVERSDEPPTAKSKELAANQAVGGLAREERAGTGEIHVITVPEDGTEAAVDDVLEDEEQLLSRAARLGVNRVEVRSSPGVLSVRYMP